MNPAWDPKPKAFFEPIFNKLGGRVSLYMILQHGQNCNAEVKYNQLILDPSDCQDYLPNVPVVTAQEEATDQWWYQILKKVQNLITKLQPIADYIMTMSLEELKKSFKRPRGT